MEKLLDCLAFGRDERTYNEDVRSFCLTLHFYSPRAYQFVRSKFNNHLPSISAIRKWYGSINSAPGFDNEAFEILEKKAKQYFEEYKRKILCACIKDEMHIRTQSQYNAYKMKFDGFVDMGEKLTSQGILPLAKEALVFLVSGIEEDFKIPIAYFFINSLDTKQSAFITNQVLTRLSQIGVEVATLTMDGPRTNQSMCNYLGATFDGKAYICDPLDEKRRIFIMLDPPHMLKLTRNCLGTRNIIDGQGRKIEWRYFELLFDAQNNLSWNLGNKLTKQHMQWEKRKMNVKLAGETISGSVADSMEFLKQECKEFSEVDGTVEFIRVINDIFDVMNSTKSTGAKGFKRPITKETAREYFDRFEYAIEYIKQLRVEGAAVPILKSISNTPFLGFYNNMVNCMSLYNEYVLTNRIDMLKTHRFSQDHIETLFSCIRSMNGHNDNPNIQQFEAAFKKLLIHNDIVSSKTSNCIETGTKILTVSSYRPTKNQNDSLISERELGDFDSNFDFDFEFDFDMEFGYEFQAADPFIGDAHSVSFNEQSFVGL